MEFGFRIAAGCRKQQRAGLVNNKSRPLLLPVVQRLFVDSLQPVEHGLLPLLPVFEILADAPAVAACRVDVHRGLDAVVLQCVVVVTLSSTSLGSPV